MIPAVMPTYARADLTFDKGEGAYIHDTDGRRYLDFGGGIAVTALGVRHCRAEAAEARVEALHVHEAHGFAADLFPGFEAIADVRNRCERFDFQINVDLAPAQVVHDHNIVALVRQIHGAGPATEAVTTENENFHPKLLLKRASRQ